MAAVRGHVAACSAVRSTRRAVRCCRGGGWAAAQRTAHRLGAVCGPSAARSRTRVLPRPGLARRARARNSGRLVDPTMRGAQGHGRRPGRARHTGQADAGVELEKRGVERRERLLGRPAASGPSLRSPLEVCPLVCMRRRRRLGASGGDQRSFFEAESWGLGPNSPSTSGP